MEEFHSWVEEPDVCSCGCAKAHPIARRETSDEHSITVFSDGALTLGRFGAFVPGLGVPRSRYGRRTRARAVRLMADDLALFTLAEIPLAIRIAEATFAHNWSSDADRRGHVLRSVDRRSA